MPLRPPYSAGWKHASHKAGRIALGICRSKAGSWKLPHASRRTFEDPLYLDDAQIAERLGMGTEQWMAPATILERSGLPRRDPLFKYHRCWWRVQDFLYRRAGGALPDDGLNANAIVEDLNALRSKRRTALRKET